MSSASLSQHQIARVRHEAEISLASARSLRDEWLVAISQNPKGLTQREIDQLSRSFQNRLLSVKWDCEDLEELVSGGDDKRKGDSESLGTGRNFLAECRDEIARCTRQLEDYEASRQMFSKHGIAPTPTPNDETKTNGASSAPSTLPNSIVTQTIAPAVGSIIQNPLYNRAHYRKLSNEQLAEEAGSELPHFDKRQIETSTSIFNNALYEHFEEEDALTKTINATKVFNNLTRPSAADICVGTNENEMILEMLETEYYNPPASLLAKAKYATALRNFFDPERNRLLSTIALLFSFPILLILFLVI